MNSAVNGRSSRVVPLKVIHMDTIFPTFEYPLSMSVGEVVDIETRYKIPLIENRYFKFHVKRTSERTVSVIIKRVVEDQTSNAGSVEEDTVESDSGCFLLLYISVIGVMEEPKTAVLKSTDSEVSVEFMNFPFFHAFPSLAVVDYTCSIKCVVRRIETTVMLDKLSRERKLVWKNYVTKDCGFDRSKMDFVLNLSKANEIETGRRTLKSSEVGEIIGRAYHYSVELARYFEAKASSNPEPPCMNLGLILGYLRNGVRASITGKECREFYLFSHHEGLMFVKELCTAYIIENLNAELALVALTLADETEDSRLFDAVLLFYLRNKLQIFNTDEWKWLESEEAHLAHSIKHSIMLRLHFHKDSTGFPPSIEDETGET